MRAGFRLLAFLLLGAAGLGGCTLLHPHRIANPNLPPGYKAQQKAARKAQKASIKAAEDEDKARRKRKDKDADDDAPADAASGVAPTEASPVSNQVSSAQPDRPTVKYDKQGLMKKPKLMRRRYYKPVRPPFRPWHSVGTFFKNIFKRRNHGQPQSAPKSADKPAQPAPAPVDTGLKP